MITFVPYDEPPNEEGQAQVFAKSSSDSGNNRKVAIQQTVGTVGYWAGKIKKGISQILLVQKESPYR